MKDEISYALKQRQMISGQLCLQNGYSEFLKCKKQTRMLSEWRALPVTSDPPVTRGLWELTTTQSKNHV